MKTRHVILTATLLLLSFSVWAIEEVKRTITKEFPVSANDEVMVNNKYGNLTISEWGKKEVAFTVEITGKGEKAKTAQEMADRVSIEFNKNGKKISAETVFKDKNFSCHNCGTTIHYTINVPTDVYLNLINKYGHITMNRTDRSFRCDLKYGNLTANQLLGESNTIQVKYGNADIDEAYDIDLEIKYGNLDLGKAKTLKYASGYSNSRIGSVDQIELDSKYDNFKIKHLGNLRMSTGYSNFDIGELKESFIVSDIKYGKVNIDDIAADFSEISIDAAYTTIRLAITSRHNFQAKLYNRYGNIKTNGLTFNNVTLNDDRHDRYAQSIAGTVGSSSSPKSKVTISNSYADIIFSGK